MKIFKGFIKLFAQPIETLAYRLQSENKIIQCMCIHYVPCFQLGHVVNFQQFALSNRNGASNNITQSNCPRKHNIIFQLVAGTRWEFPVSSHCLLLPPCPFHCSLSGQSRVTILLIQNVSAERYYAQSILYSVPALDRERSFITLRKKT